MLALNAARLPRSPRRQPIRMRKTTSSLRVRRRQRTRVRTLLLAFDSSLRTPLHSFCATRVATDLPLAAVLVRTGHHPLLTMPLLLPERPAGSEFVWAGGSGLHGRDSSSDVCGRVAGLGAAQAVVLAATKLRKWAWACQWQSEAFVRSGHGAWELGDGTWEGGGLRLWWRLTDVCYLVLSWSRYKEKIPPGPGAKWPESDCGCGKVPCPCPFARDGPSPIAAPPPARPRESRVVQL